MDLGFKLKQENPWNRANILSKLFFGWMLDFIREGSRDNITLKTLYKPLETDKSENVTLRLEENWNNEIEISQKLKRKPSLLRALVKTFILECMWYGLLWFLGFGILSSLQPFVLKKLISLFIDLKYEDERTKLYVASALLVGILFSMVLVLTHCRFGMARFGMRLRVASSSLIYRKIMRLSQRSLGKTAAGQVINLLSNDVNRFDLVVIALHGLWVMPFQLGILTFFMWQQVGISCLSGIILMIIISLPLQGYLATILGRLRLKISKKTDRRVKLINEILAGIQVIKMYAWEKPFEKVIKLIRHDEMKYIRTTSYIRGVYASCSIFNDRISLFLTVVIFILLGNYITSDKVFSLFTAFNFLQLAMAIIFPLAISLGAETLISIRRLEEFLLMEERSTKNITYTNKTGIVLSDSSASWTESGSILKEISLRIPPGTLCAVVGPVGAGKSSLLQLLLGELSAVSGNVQIGGEISYSSQEPWLFQSTVRNNITFGKPFEKNWYEKVVRVCALERDLEQFPQGDRTIVGERGVALSGGQRARINLARAIYRKADIYLLDDPLSAVDTHVGNHLLDECICQHLQGKIRILVTHQLQYLKKADIIVVINDGKIEAQGTYEELSNMKLDFTKMFTDEDKEKNDEASNAEIAINDRKFSAVSIISHKSDVNLDNTVDEDAETDPNSKPLIRYVQATNQKCLVILTGIFLVIAQGLCAGADYWIAFWVNNDQKLHSLEISLDSNPNITYVGGFHNEIYHSFEIYGVVENILKTEYGMIFYGVILGLGAALTVTRSVMFYKMCITSSTNLHNSIFYSIIRAPMSFFDTNPSGRVLNRFSKDLGAVDEVLPRVLLDSIQIFLVAGFVLVNVAVSNPYFIIAMVVLGFVFFKFKSLYISIAKSVKHLEGITKSPVFTHVNSTLNGITTIRSSKAEDILIDEFDSHQDVHSASWFLVISTTNTFSMWLDLICTTFAGIVTFAFVIVSIFTEVNGSLIGLAISQSLILIGMLQQGMRQTAEVINQLVSVERIDQYTSLVNEGPFETLKDKILIEQWPTKGLIEFKNVTLKYVPTDPPVLNSLSFKISPGEKVGIVGRTGAGKSSLIAALFRLAPLDGVDTKDIGLADLRKRISIIPQEPVLFSSTLRYNLDPFGEYDDQKIWKALEQVDLKDSVDSLDFLVSQGGANFSVGQRQLICLARAAIRSNNILVLDEATANVDHKTDSFIQKTIRERFKDCTVLTIAHRLNTIMDSDKVLVMSFGSVVDFDHPYNLLQMPESYFNKMVQETGPAMTEQLNDAAFKAFSQTLK